MTSTVDHVTRTALSTGTYGQLSSTVGITAIVLLLLLLMLKEFHRASGRPWARVNLRALDIAIMPLFLSFAVVVATRFAIDVLHLK